MSQILMYLIEIHRYVSGTYLQKLGGKSTLTDISFQHTNLKNTKNHENVLRVCLIQKPFHYIFRSQKLSKIMFFLRGSG